MSQVCSVTNDIAFGYRNLMPFVSPTGKIDALWGAQAPHQVSSYYVYVGDLEEAKKYCDLAVTLIFNAPDIATFRQIGLSLKLWIVSIEQYHDTSEEFLSLHESISL
ncbi:hypothetical protein HDU67_005468, partial [Dinochytrium kinnereticum]